MSGFLRSFGQCSPQVLITAQAFNLALRDIQPALEIDPCHEKTLLRRAHCYEHSDPERSMADLDLLLYLAVPDRLVHNRRNFLFLQSILKAGKEATEQVEADVAKLQLGADSEVEIEGKQFTLANLPMAALMDLSLADLRDLDSRVGRQDGNYKQQ